MKILDLAGKENTKINSKLSVVAYMVSSLTAVQK